LTEKSPDVAQAKLQQVEVIQISINFAAFVPIQNGGRQREVAYSHNRNEMLPPRSSKAELFTANEDIRGVITSLTKLPPFWDIIRFLAL